MEEALRGMRKTYGGDEAARVFEAFRSHASIAKKNRLLLALLHDIRSAHAEVRRLQREAPGVSDDVSPRAFPPPFEAPKPCLCPQAVELATTVNAHVREVVCSTDGMSSV